MQKTLLVVINREIIELNEVTGSLGIISFDVVALLKQKII